MIEIVRLLNEMSPYLLLGFFLAGLMHAFIPAGCYTQHLSRPSFASVWKAALFGIPLPLCSCGVIPTAMSLHKEGASKGAVTAFLIATPQTGVDSIFATFSLMGLPFAIVRPVAALLTSVMGGFWVNVGERKTTDTANHVQEKSTDAPSRSFAARMKTALNYAFVEMMEDIGKWLVIGMVVAGIITVFVPDSLFDAFRGNTVASMLLVLVISVPMYLCATGSIPIAVALMMKGLTPGAALVLLMAGPACNMASMLVVRQVLGTRTLVKYIVSIVSGAILFGVVTDLLQANGIVNFTATLSAADACCMEESGWLGSSLFSWLCSMTLALLLLHALVWRRFRPHGRCACGNHECEAKASDAANVLRFRVEGMNCNHCRQAAEKALRSVKGVENATVNLADGEAEVTGDASLEDLRQALEAVGFRLKEHEKNE